MPDSSPNEKAPDSSAASRRRRTTIVIAFDVAIAIMMLAGRMWFGRTWYFYRIDPGEALWIVALLCFIGAFHVAMLVEQPHKYKAVGALIAAGLGLLGLSVLDLMLEAMIAIGPR